MKVLIKLFATLQQYGAEEQEVTLPENSTVADVILMLKIPENMPMLRIVNGVHVKKTHVLKEGDVLALFPPIAGGFGELNIKRRMRKERIKPLRHKAFFWNH